MRTAWTLALLLPLLGWPGTTWPQGLGRLFFTPGERAALDRGRTKGNRQAHGQPGPLASSSDAGDIRPSRSRNLIRINGRTVFPASDGQPPAAAEGYTQALPLSRPDHGQP